MRMRIQARPVDFYIFVLRTSAADRLAPASAGLADRVFIIPLLLIRRFTLLIDRRRRRLWLG